MKIKGRCNTFDVNAVRTGGYKQLYQITTFSLLPTKKKAEGTKEAANSVNGEVKNKNGLVSG